MPAIFVPRLFGGPVQYTPSSNPYGVTIQSQGGMLNPVRVLDMQNMGIGWCRFFVNWTAMETGFDPVTGAPIYDFSLWDDAVAKCNAAGISFVATIQGPPAWRCYGWPGPVPPKTDPNPCNPTKSWATPAAAAQFASDVATRYNGSTINLGTGKPYGFVASIESANEGYDDGASQCQDGGFAVPMQQAVWAAVKAASPTCLVGAPAELQLPKVHVKNWITGYYAAGGGGFNDYHQIHFYPGMRGPNTDDGTHVTMAQYAGTIVDPIVGVATAYGFPNVGVWMTETGYPQNNLDGSLGPCAPLTSYAQQACLLQETLDAGRLSNGQIDKVFLYTLAGSDGYSPVSGSGSETFHEGYYMYAGNGLGYGTGYTTQYPVWSGGVSPATLSVTPTTLSFSGIQGQPDPSSQLVTLADTGMTGTAWTSAIAYTSGSGWLSLSPTSGTLSASGTQPVSISASMGSLAPDSYSATITFTAVSGGSTATLTVALTIGAIPSGPSSPVAQDTFSRVNQSNWGIASDGTDTWNKVIGGATLSISSNTGLVASHASATVVTLGTGMLIGGDFLVRFNSSHNTSQTGLVVRYLDANNYMRCEVFNGTLRFRKTLAGVLSTLSPTAAPTINASTGYWIHVNVLGSLYSANVWADGTSEPPGWMLTVTDTSFTGKAGGYGLFANLAVASDTIAYDQYAATTIFNTYYVATGGNDSNPGTSALPWHTFSKVAAATQAGDTIFVGDGSYSGQVALTASGTALAPILIQALDRQKAAIIETATHGIGAYCLDVSGDYITLDGFEVTGPDVQYGVLLADNFSTVTHSWVHDVCQSFDPGSSGGGGIVHTIAGFALSGPTINANRIERIGGTTPNSNVHGIYLQTSNPSGAGKVTNNLVLNVAGFGIGMWQNPNNWVVTDNDVINCLTGGISCNGNTGSSYLADRNTIQDNILYANGSGTYYPAIWSGSDNCGPHNIFRNNLADFPGGPFSVTEDIPRAFGSTILLSEGAGVAIYDFTPANVNPLQTASNLPNADPLFVNYQPDGSGNYQLQTGSPAIDTGYGPLSPTTDYAGTTRPQGAGYDVGCYEYIPSFVFMTAGGNGVLFDEDTFHLIEKLDERQRFQATVLDYAGTQTHPFSERVVVADPTLGRLFSGFVVDDKQDKTNTLTSAMIEHQLDCVDNRHLAGKRTSDLVYSTPTYAGKIVVDMVEQVLADEGIIAFHATHEDDTQNDFALGTLTNTQATNNNGGDLELLGSGGFVSASYPSQASWSAGTLSNVVANPGGDISLIGATRTYDDGDFSNQTLYGAGSPTQGVTNKAFFLTCAPQSETRARLDFAGPWSSVSTPAIIGMDMDLGGVIALSSFTYRTTSWSDSDLSYGYAVEMNLGSIALLKGNNGGSGTPTTLASHTFSPPLGSGWYRVQATVSGNTHTIAVNGTTYLTFTDNSSPYTAAGYIAIRNRNTETGTIDTEYFDNFGVMQATSGTWTSPSTSVTSVGFIVSSIISWDSSLSTGGTVLVQSSINGGSTWSNCANGGSIPGLGKGASGTGLSLLIKITLSTGNTSLMPDIQNLQWSVTGGYVASGTRTSLISNQTYATDTFNRANQSGWGTASDGELWHFDSGAGTLAIASHTGTVTGTSTLNYMRLGTQVLADSTATVRIALGDSGDENGILLRYSNAGTHYRAYLGNFNQLVIERVVGTVRKQLATAPFALSLGTFYWMRFQLQGPTLSARAWIDGSKEPDTWLIITTDTSIGTGNIGLFSFPNSASAVTFDHLTVASIGVGPSLDLTPVGQLGTSFVSWNALTPTSTSLGVDISLDKGLTWTDVSNQNGGPLPGLNGQPEPTTDGFTSDTSMSYTSTAGTGGSTALTLYTASAVSSTFSTADQLYTLLGTPATTQTYSRVGTATGYGELVAQGTTGAWLAATKLPATPTGKGFFLNSFQLVGQQLLAGAWSGNVSLNCAQNGSGNPHAGSLTADIIVRAFSYNTVSGVYTPIVVLRANSQALTSTTTTFTLPTVTTSGPTSFGSNDILYLDYWLNVRTNGNGSSVQDVRTNSLSTDTSGMTGNIATSIATPGYVATGSSGAGAGANILGAGASASVDTGLAGVSVSPLNSSSNPYGVTIGSSAPDGSLNHQAIVDMQNLGMTALRYQIRWSNIDQSGTTSQNPATYHWNAWDSAVQQCNAAGIAIGLTVFNPPAQFSSGGNPDVPNYTATFATQVAQRYNGGAKGTVNIIEMGNEDYDNSSGTSATPLVATMKAVYPAVKAVSGAITVGCAALLQRNSTHYTNFMETLLNPSTGAYNKGVLQTDYLNFHFYTGIPNSGAPDYTPVAIDPTTSIPSWNGGAGLCSIRDNHDSNCAWQLIAAKKSQYGVSVPTWLTETGFQININPSSQRHPANTVSQAVAWQYLNDVLDACRTSGGQVTRLFLFTLGYYDGYGSPNYRDGESIVQGPLSNPQYTTAYTNLKAYTAQYPQWSGGGGGSGPITVSPSSLTFTATAGGGNPANQTDVLTNPQGTSQAWTSSIAYSSGSGWLALSPTSGTIVGNGTQNVTVSATTGSLAVGTYSATITYTSSGVVTQHVTFTVSSGNSSLLPGQFIAASGASNLVFGSNIPPDFGSPPKPIGLVTTPQIQAQMKAAGVTVLRMNVSSGPTQYTDAQINQRINAIKACGAIPLVIIGHDADSGPTWPFAQHVVSLLGSQCNLYEIFNEPDLNPNINGYTGYLAAWNQIVPLLSALNPQAAFIGPVLGVVANFSSYLIPWLQGTISSGVLPDALSFHDYPCGAQPSQSVCATKAVNIGNDIASLRGLISAGGVLGPTAGAAMPICVTEWNLDWHNPPVGYANQANSANASYINTWYTNAYAGMVANTCAMSCQFDASGNAEGGQADLISVNSPYPQQDGYAAVQSAVAQYLGSGSGGSGPISVSPGSLSFAINLGQGNPPSQGVLLSNPQTGTQAWSTSITYGSGSGWLAISPASGSIGGGGSQSATVTATTGSLTAGTYTAVITYTSSGVVTQNVTFTVSSGGGTTALTAYFSSTPSPITPTANKVYTILGTPPDTNVASQLGNALNFGEVWSQGNTGPWAGTSTIGAPTGHGFLWGALTLEGQTLSTGTYTGAVRLNIIGVGSVGITADVHCRLFKWNAATGYSAIADCVLSGQSIGTTKSVFAPTFTTVTATAFSTGDKLYVDIWLKVLTNTNGATAQVNFNNLSADSTGFTGQATAGVTTPGYSPTGGGGGAITVSPGVLSFFALSGGGNPPNQTAVLTNPQGSAQAWNGSITYGSGSTGWLSLAPTSGSVPGSGTENVTISVSTGSLAIGTYIATITYTSSGVVTQNILLTISESGGGGGSDANWLYDTSNSRLIASGGSQAVYYLNTTPYANIDLLTDMDESDAGGLAWNFITGTFFYAVQVADNQSGVATPNTITLSRTSAGATTQVGQANIDFPRGTYHRIRATFNQGTVTVSFDGDPVIVFVDGVPLGAGSYGLYNNGGIARFYQLWTQPLGDDVTGVVVDTRLRLATADTTVTPAVLTLTVAAFGPQIDAGALIPSVAYQHTFCDKNLDDLAKKSNYSWWIDQNLLLYFNHRQGLPAPWIAQSNNIGLPSDIELDGNLLVDVAGDVYRNRQVLTGVTNFSNFVDPFIGDNTKTSFTLRYPVVATSAIPTITLNGVKQKVGVKGSSGSQWYYADGDATIAQDSGGTALLSTDSLIVTYVGSFIDTVTVNNTVAQAALKDVEQVGTGIVEDVQDVSSPGMLYDAAVAYAQALLDRYCIVDPVTNLPTGRTVTFKTYRNGLHAGMIQPIVIPEESIKYVNMLINQVDRYLQTQPNGQRLYGYVVQASDLPRLASFPKLLADGLLGN